MTDDERWHARADVVVDDLRSGELSLHDVEARLRELLDDQAVPEGQAL
jgi:hypothetical protein